MKKLVFILIILFSSFNIIAQDIPNVQIKKLNGSSVQTKDVINNDDGPVLLSFWATYCKPCIKELNAYDENYIDWQEETGVKIILISIDNSRSMHRVAPFVNGKGWEFETYLDPNSSFKRAMNVVNAPHTFLLSSEGEVVWQHTSYMDGDEYKVYEEIKKQSLKEEE